MLRRLSIVVILGAIMSMLDTTIVNVAIETLARDFHTSISTMQWVTTGYLLSLAIVIPMSGWTVERFGAKRMWLISLGLFTVGSALCGLAWSSESLILFRVLQGFGGGMLMPVGQTILARAAGPQRIGRVMSVLGVPTLIAPVFGPVLGGLIVDNTSWRWIFYVNVPIGIAAILLSLRFLVGGERQDAGRFDFVGVALLSPGLASLVYGLSEAGGGSGFGSTTVVVCMAVGAVLVLAFVVHALRIERPLLDIRLFRDRSFAMANVTIFIFGAALYAGDDPAAAVLPGGAGGERPGGRPPLAPQGVGAMLTMPLGGRLTDRIGAGTVVPIGMAVFLLGTVAYTQLGPATGYWWLALSLIVRGLGMGWAMMPLDGRRLRQSDAHTGTPGHHHPQHPHARRAAPSARPWWPWCCSVRSANGCPTCRASSVPSPPRRRSGCRSGGPPAFGLVRVRVLGGGGDDGGRPGVGASSAQGPAGPGGFRWLRRRAG